APSTVAEAARDVRLAIRDQVPGSGLEWRRIRLPADMEEFLTAQIDAPTAAALEPDVASTVISQVKEQVRSHPRTKTVLVVRDWRLAGFLHNLLEYEDEPLLVATDAELTPKEAEHAG